MNVSGGTSAIKYYVSGEYLNQKGIGITTAFQKATLRANLEAEINKFVTIGNNVQMLYNQSNGNRRARLSDVIFNAPITPAYDADGTYGEPDPKYTSSKNAIPEVSWNSPKNNNYRLLDNLFVEFTFTDWLKFRFNGGIDVALTSTAFSRQSITMGANQQHEQLR